MRGSTGWPPAYSVGCSSRRRAVTWSVTSSAPGTSAAGLDPGRRPGRWSAAHGRSGAPRGPAGRGPARPPATTVMIDADRAERGAVDRQRARGVAERLHRSAVSSWACDLEAPGAVDVVGTCSVRRLLARDQLGAGVVGAEARQRRRRVRRRATVTGTGTVVRDGDRQRGVPRGQAVATRWPAARSARRRGRARLPAGRAARRRGRRPTAAGRRSQLDAVGHRCTASGRSASRPSGRRRAAGQRRSRAAARSAAAGVGEQRAAAASGGGSAARRAAVEVGGGAGRRAVGTGEVGRRRCVAVARIARRGGAGSGRRSAGGGAARSDASGLRTALSATSDEQCGQLRPAARVGPVTAAPSAAAAASVASQR